MLFTYNIIMSRIPSESDQQIVIDEATTLTEEILSKWLPHLKKRQYPKIALKFGGHTAYYIVLHNEIVNCIVLRYDSWNMRDIFGKRILLIHEIYHSFGMPHSSKDGFNTSFDFLSIQIYEKIWGKDEYYRKMKENTKKILADLDKRVPILNQRKLQIKKLKTKYKLI